MGCSTVPRESASTVSMMWPWAWAASKISALVSLPSNKIAAAPVSPVSEPKRTEK
jgi:hypothetical protein